MKNTKAARRHFVKSSTFGLLAISIPNISYAKEIIGSPLENKNIGELHDNYPAIDYEIANKIVGASHFNFDSVKELVDKRPELARATWDWRFGDWETAIGAASHVGRRDIVEYLMSKGARPNIFTFAMLGAYETVKAMIEHSPGVQRIEGPHGISLLQHAKNGMRMKDELTEKNVSESEKLIAYLESLGDADGKKYLEMKEGDKEKYLGDYMYGTGEKEGFSIKLNMRKLISLAGIGQFGGALYKIEENRYTYNGAPSVEVTFQFEKEKVVSLTLHEPGLTLKAIKV